LRKNHQDDVREKIQASAIINRLMGHVNGETDLSSTQVKAAEILLRKTLPDLASTALTGADGKDLEIGLIARTVVDPANA